MSINLGSSFKIVILHSFLTGFVSLCLIFRVKIWSRPHFEVMQTTFKRKSIKPIHKDHFSPLFRWRSTSTSWWRDDNISWCCSCSQRMFCSSCAMWRSGSLDMEGRGRPSVLNPNSLPPLPLHFLLTCNHIAHIVAVSIAKHSMLS